MIEENYMVEKRKAEKSEQRSERKKRENGKMYIKREKQAPLPHTQRKGKDEKCVQIMTTEMPTFIRETFRNIILFQKATLVVYDT